MEVKILNAIWPCVVVVKLASRPRFLAKETINSTPKKQKLIIRKKMLYKFLKNPNSICILKNLVSLYRNFCVVWCVFIVVISRDSFQSMGPSHYFVVRDQGHI